MAEYQTNVPDRQVLQAKLDESFELVEREEEALGNGQGTALECQTGKLLQRSRLPIQMA